MLEGSASVGQPVPSLRGLLLSVLGLQGGVQTVLQNENMAETTELLFFCEREPKKAPLTVECSTLSAEVSLWCHGHASVKSISLALMGTSDPELWNNIPVLLSLPRTSFA